MKIYDTQTKEKRKFEPIEKGKIKFYVCGITPYDHSHMGHLVSALRFNVIRKYLEFSGYQVSFIQNITDIDDKIIKVAKDKGKTPQEISEFYSKEYSELLNKFKIDPPTKNPKVSEYIAYIIKYIQELIDDGSAYETTKGNVYFDVSKKTDYGKLSGQKISEMVSGERADTEKDKKNPLDFALWKTEDFAGAFWKSPWGKGRPGWHIECSVMANTILGEQIDLHGGGLDLLFPHHENEVAQCEAHNHNTFSNFWLHSGLLNINGQKMSKSLGNFITIEDAIKEYGTELIKYMTLKNHYRSSISLSDKNFAENLNNVLSLYRFYEKNKTNLEKTGAESSDLMTSFRSVMDNDFNTPEAVVVFEKSIERGDEKLFFSIKKIADIFNLFNKNPKEVYEELINFNSIYRNVRPISLDEIELKMSRMKIYRDDKKYNESDIIRNELSDLGIEVMQNNGNIEWRFRNVS